MSYLRRNIAFLCKSKGVNPDDFPTFPTLNEVIQIGKTLEVSLDRLLTHDLEAEAGRFQSKDIQLLVLDVDGVLTDGGMYFTENGDEIKRYNTKDGRAIMACNRAGIEVAFLSGGVKTKVIADRGERLGVKRIYVGLEPKLGILDGWRKELGLSWDQIAYIGDDMNDQKVMEKVGLAGCPADAAPAILDVADWVLSRKGGDACVREFIEAFLCVVDR